MKKVTAWSTINDKGEFVHNHLENGWVKGSKPVGHPSWVKREWKKEFGFLNDDSTFEKVG